MSKNRFFNGLQLGIAALAFSLSLVFSVSSFAQDGAPAANNEAAAAATETAAPADAAADVSNAAPTDAASDVVKEADETCEAKEAGCEDAAKHYSVFSRFGFYWLLALAGSVSALVFAWKFFKTMMQADEGTDEMKEIAAAVREGANAYLIQQYKVVAMFFVVIWAFLMFLAFGLHVQSQIVPWAFLTGGFFSGLAGWCGMKTATWASSRTALALKNR